MAQVTDAEVFHRASLREDAPTLESAWPNKSPAYRHRIQMGAHELRLHVLAEVLRRVDVVIEGHSSVWTVPQYGAVAEIRECLDSLVKEARS